MFCTVTSKDFKGPLYLAIHKDFETLICAQPNSNH